MKFYISSLLLAGAAAVVTTATATVPLTTLLQEDLDGTWNFSQLNVPDDLRLSFTTSVVGPNQYRTYTLEDADRFEADTGAVPVYGGGSLVDVPDSGGTVTRTAILEPSGRYVINGQVHLWPNDDLDLMIAGQHEDGTNFCSFISVVRPLLGGTTADLAGEWRFCTLLVPDAPFLNPIAAPPPATAYELARGDSGFFDVNCTAIEIDAAGVISAGGIPTGDTASLDAAGQISSRDGTWTLSSGGDYFSGVNPFDRIDPDDSWEYVVGVRLPAGLSLPDLEGEWVAASMEIPDFLDFSEDPIPSVFYNYVLEDIDGLFASVVHLTFDDSGNFVGTSPGDPPEAGTVALGGSPGDLIIDVGGNSFPGHVNTRKNIFIAGQNSSNSHELIVAVRKAPFLCAPDWGGIVFTRVSDHEITALIPDDGTMTFELEGSPELINWTLLSISSAPIGLDQVLLTFSSAPPLPDKYFVRVLSRVTRTP